jgi:hypothetical protein
MLFFALTVSAVAAQFGAYKPQCREEDQEFNPLQCHGSTGYCWCVDRNGAELENTRVFGERPTCEFMTSCRTSRFSAAGLIGAFHPQCDEEGNFESFQCHGSTGFCWCVDPNGAQVGEQVRGRPDCSQVVFSEDSLLSPCQLKLKYSRGRIGAYSPQCEDDGSFRPTQCHGSTGRCWCVDSFGVEIEETRGPGMRECNKVTRCQVVRDGVSVAFVEDSSKLQASSGGKSGFSTPSVTALVCVAVGTSLVAAFATIRYRNYKSKRPLILPETLATSPEQPVGVLNVQLLQRQEP